MLTIDRTLRLPASEFIAGPMQKSLIVLHHTVGGSAKSSFEYWRDDPRRVGTAYLVERDGTVYEVFPPDGWAYHLGVKDDAIERRSIGIELASEGGLTLKRGDDGTMYAYAFDGKRNLGKAMDLRWQQRLVMLDEPWRGFTWFDAYDEPQIVATIALVLHLCEQFGIPKAMPTPEECRGPAQFAEWYGYRGVLHHAMLRKDKSDLHPRFPYERLQAALQGG